jgi:hypothetical protein
MKCGGGGTGLPLAVLAVVLTVGCPSEDAPFRPASPADPGMTGMAGIGDSAGNAGATTSEASGGAGAGGVESALDGGVLAGGAPPLAPMPSSPDCPDDLDEAYEVSCTLEGKACVVVSGEAGCWPYEQVGFVCRDGLWRLTGCLNACPENLCGDGDLGAVGAPCAGEGRVCHDGCCGDYESGAVKCSGGVWKLTSNPTECGGEGGGSGQSGGGGAGEGIGGVGGQP